MHWPYIPPSLQAQPHADLFGYTTPVSQRKRLTGLGGLNGAVTSRNTCTSDCSFFVRTQPPNEAAFSCQSL